MSRSVRKLAIGIALLAAGFAGCAPLRHLRRLPRPLHRPWMRHRARSWLLQHVVGRHRGPGGPFTPPPNSFGSAPAMAVPALPTVPGRFAPGRTGDRSSPETVSYRASCDGETSRGRYNACLACSEAENAGSAVADLFDFTVENRSARSDPTGKTASQPVRHAPDYRLAPRTSASRWNNDETPIRG